MDFAALMTAMTRAAVTGDGRAVGDCFTEDGVYHDVFYGAFRGRAAIADMIENHFHRDAENFRWDLHEPVSDGRLGYLRYVFSFDSKLPEAAGRRALFEGVAILRLEDGLVAEYREVANPGPGLAMLGFPPERLAKFLARQAEALATRPEAADHVKR